MSMRCSGLASRSFIIGSRLWPPAMMRASGPRRCSAAIASSTLSARWYSNGAGVCTGLSFRVVALGLEDGRGGPPLPDARRVARLVLHRRVGADDRRAGELLRARLARLRVERARREAAARHVAKDRAAGRARSSDRRLAAQARQRERALRVDLGDPRRLRRLAVREVAEARGRGTGVQAVDEADGVAHARLLDEQALEQIDARVEVAVDRRDDLLDRRALLDDLLHRADRLVEAQADLAQRDDRRDEVVDEDEHDRDDRDQQDNTGCGHRYFSSASSRITSSDVP